ncbi:hypothetical protein KKD62_00950 [Patescibacteria group bacterium]|nr:hypothetical protein [Patescibacteria group bacterium]MBU1931145.1 hypothetical protein [Patescibacteria group bacterium]
MTAKWRVLLVLVGIFCLVNLYPVRVNAACTDIDEFGRHTENPYPESACPVPPSEDADWCSADLFTVTKEVKIPRSQACITTEDRHIECEAGVTALYTELPLLNVTRDDVRPCLDTGTLKWEYILPWLVGEQKREPVADTETYCGHLTDPILFNKCLSEIFKEQEARSGVLQKLTSAEEQNKLKIQMIERLHSVSSLDQLIHDYIVCYYDSSGKVINEQDQLTPTGELRSDIKEWRLSNYTGNLPPENNCQYLTNMLEYSNCQTDYQKRLKAWKKTIAGQCWSAVPMVSKDPLKVPLILAVPNDGPNGQTGSLWGDGNSGKSFSLGRANLFLPHVQGTIEATGFLQKLLAPKESNRRAETSGGLIIASPANYTSSVLAAQACGASCIYKDNPLGVNGCNPKVTVWNPGDYIYGPPGENGNNPWIPDKGTLLQTDWTVAEDIGNCDNPKFDDKYLVSGIEAKCVSDECRSYPHIDDLGNELCRCWRSVPEDTYRFSTQGLPWMVPGDTFKHLADIFAFDKFAFLRSLSLYSGDIYPEPGSGQEILKMPGEGSLGYGCEGSGTYASGYDKGLGKIYYEWLGTLQNMRQELIRNRYPAEFGDVQTTLEKNMAGWTGFGYCKTSSSGYSSLPATPGSPGTYPVPPIPADDPICGGDKYCNPYCYEDHYKHYYVQQCFDTTYDYQGQSYTVDFCSQQYTYLIFGNSEDPEKSQQDCCHSTTDLHAYLDNGTCAIIPSPSPSPSLPSCNPPVGEYKILTPGETDCSNYSHIYPVLCQLPSGQIVCRSSSDQNNTCIDEDCDGFVGYIPDECSISEARSNGTPIPYWLCIENTCQLRFSDCLPK